MNVCLCAELVLWSACGQQSTGLGSRHVEMEHIIAHARTLLDTKINTDHNALLINVSELLHSFRFRFLN